MKSKIALGLILLALAASAPLGHAQDDNGGPGGPPPGDFGNGGPGGPGGSGDFNNRNGGPGGNFDPAQFQQRMLDETRTSLNVTNDEEWAAIEPLVQKVMNARREARTGGGMGMFGRPGGPNGRGGPGGQASAEQQALQSALEASAPVAQVKDTLAKLRAAQKVKQAALESAQNDLKKVLNVRQEAQAVLMGLLQ